MIVILKDKNKEDETTNEEEEDLSDDAISLASVSIMTCSLRLIVGYIGKLRSTGVCSLAGVIYNEFSHFSPWEAI